MRNKHVFFAKNVALSLLTTTRYLLTNSQSDYRICKIDKYIFNHNVVRTKKWPTSRWGEWVTDVLTTL